MNQTELSRITSKRGFAVALSVVLWLASAFLALASIFALRDILVWLLTNLLIKPNANSNYDAIRSIDVANDCGAIIFGILGLGVIIVSSEYFFRHAGQPRLIRILAGLIALECGIVLPVALLYWRT